MCGVGLIPHVVEKNTTFDSIMTSFMYGFTFKSKLEDGFYVFYKISGPFVVNMIKQTIQDTIIDTL